MHDHFWAFCKWFCKSCTLLFVLVWCLIGIINLGPKYIHNFKKMILNSGKEVLVRLIKFWFTRQKGIPTFFTHISTSACNCSSESFMLDCQWTIKLTWSTELSKLQVGARLLRNYLNFYTMVTEVTPPKRHIFAIMAPTFLLSLSTKVKMWHTFRKGTHSSGRLSTDAVTIILS